MFSRPSEVNEQNLNKNVKIHEKDEDEDINDA